MWALSPDSDCGRNARDWQFPRRRSYAMPYFVFMTFTLACPPGMAAGPTQCYILLGLQQHSFDYPTLDSRQTWRSAAISCSLLGSILAGNLDGKENRRAVSQLVRATGNFWTFTISASSGLVNSCPQVIVESNGVSSIDCNELRPFVCEASQSTLRGRSAHYVLYLRLKLVANLPHPN